MIESILKDKARVAEAQRHQKIDMESHNQRERQSHR